MTRPDGTTVRLDYKDMAKIATALIAALAVLVASWTSTNISVARLEEKVDALESRIAVLELTIRANAWSLSQ